MKIEIDTKTKEISLFELEEDESLDVVELGDLLRYLSDKIYESVKVTMSDEDAELVRSGGWEADINQPIGTHPADVDGDFRLIDSDGNEVDYPDVEEGK